MTEVSDKKVSDLVRIVLGQTKVFLDDADEFYPFASIVDFDGNIKPVSVYFGEEFPTSLEMLSKLESALKSGITENRYLIAIIGIDVFVSNKNEEKKNAIELRVYDNQSCRSKYYLYYKSGNQYIFEPHTI